MSMSMCLCSHLSELIKNRKFSKKQFFNVVNGKCAIKFEDEFYLQNEWSARNKKVLEFGCPRDFSSDNLVASDGK